VNANPDELLFHESFYFSLLPLHIGVRQYWRDFEALEKWTRTFPHEKWTKSFLHDPKGTGFWHETYCLQGGMEGIYGMREPVGLLQFAQAKPAVGGMLTARGRLKQF